jgi:8-oxo-dGTP pyrophosphatase MutT (NUDIX family)
MHRQKLLNLLKQYQPYNKHELEMKNQLVEFVTKTENCFDNYCKKGHITASAWILDKENRKVGLVHHKIMNKWLQPGGHSDNNPDTPKEALREAQEEFGKEALRLESENIFDIDLHTIKEDKKRNLGEHYHFDIRFLILGNSDIPPKVSDESNDVKWIELDKVLELNSEEGMRRMVEKTSNFITTINEQ